MQAGALAHARRENALLPLNPAAAPHGRYAPLAARAGFRCGQSGSSSNQGRVPVKREGDEYGTNSAMSQLPPEREPPMADDPNNRGPADRSRISLLEPHEVQYWADKFGVSKERLSEAVRKVGHSVEAVSRELTGSR